MKYIIDGKRLASLLRKEWKLAALEAGGVDNWDWYGESLFPDTGETYEDVENKSDEELLENYEKVKE